MQAEQWGFLGSLALLCPSDPLVLKSLQVVRDAKGFFATLVAAGVAGALLFQVCTNVGMVTGLLPVVGVPLPLLSYGGSSLVTTMLSLGLVLNIHMRPVRLLNRRGMCAPRWTGAAAQCPAGVSSRLILMGAPYR